MPMDRWQARVATLALLLACACSAEAPHAPETAAPPRATVLLATGETILGQPVAYPTGAAPQITAAIITLDPGASTGWHRHAVPLVAYMLEGELTVAYEGHGERVYRQGDSLVEAIGTAHEGSNVGDDVVRILAVFAGAEGVPNSEPVE